MPPSSTLLANGPAPLEATRSVEGEDGASEASVTTTGDAGSSADPPSQTEYSSGPVAGFVTELGYENAPAYILGPGSETGHGLGIELGPGHVGMTFSTVSLGGDSDGWFFAAPDGEPLPEVHNAGDEAGGVVPADAGWLLVISWAAPSDDLVVTFTP